MRRQSNRNSEENDTGGTGMEEYSTSIRRGPPLLGRRLDRSRMPLTVWCRAEALRLDSIPRNLGDLEQSAEKPLWCYQNLIVRCPRGARILP